MLQSTHKCQDLMRLSLGAREEIRLVTLVFRWLMYVIGLKLVDLNFSSLMTELKETLAEWNTQAMVLIK